MNRGHYMRTTGAVLLGMVPGAASLIATEDGGNVPVVLAGIGTLVAGVIAAIALLRRQDTDSAIKSLQDMLSRQEKTICDLQAHHAACEEKHTEMEGRFNQVANWLRRNKSAMETSGARLEPFPSLD